MCTSSISMFFGTKFLDFWTVSLLPDAWTIFARALTTLSLVVRIMRGSPIDLDEVVEDFSIASVCNISVSCASGSDSGLSSDTIEEAEWFNKTGDDIMLLILWSVDRFGGDECSPDACVGGGVVDGDGDAVLEAVTVEATIPVAVVFIGGDFDVWFGISLADEEDAGASFVTGVVLLWGRPLVFNVLEGFVA